MSEEVNTVAEEPIEGNPEDLAEQAEEENEETEEETEESTEEAEKPVPKDELKIVIVMREDRMMVGVQRTECDPVYETIQGSLSDVLTRIPNLVEEAKQKWAETPKNPKANLPAPPAPAPSTVSTRPRTPTTPKQPPAQPSFF